MDMPEVFPEIDANPASFYGDGQRVGHFWSSTRQYANYGE